MSNLIGQMKLSSEIPDVYGGKRKICFLRLLLDSLFSAGQLIKLNVANYTSNPPFGQYHNVSVTLIRVRLILGQTRLPAR